MIKKAALALFGLIFAIALAAPQKANAQVAFGVAVGPYAVRPYAYVGPTYPAYGYYGPSYYAGYGYSPYYYGGYYGRGYGYGYRRYDRDDFRRGYERHEGYGRGEYRHEGGYHRR